MPVRKVRGGYRYGSSGKTYPDRASAERQGRAIRASQGRQAVATKKPRKRAQKRVVSKGIGSSFTSRTVHHSSVVRSGGMKTYKAESGASFTTTKHSRAAHSVQRASVRGGVLGNVAGTPIPVPGASIATMYVGAREARNKRIEKIARNPKRYGVQPASHPVNRRGISSAKASRPMHNGRTVRKGHPKRGAGGKFAGWTS